MRFPPAFSSEDPSSEFLLAGASVSLRDPIWHGNYSLIGLPHPGPAYLHLVWLGRRVGPLVGLREELGVVLVHDLAILAAAAVAGWLVARMTRRWWPAAATVAATVTLSKVLFFVTPQAVAAAAFVVAVVAAAAVLYEVPRTVVVLAAAASMLVQVTVESAVPGTVFFVAAAVVLVRRRRRLTRGEVVLAALPLVATAVVAVVRLVDEGLGLPLAYVRRARTARSVHVPEGGAFTEALERIHPWSFAGPVVVYVGAVAIAFAAVCLGRSAAGRRHRSAVALAASAAGIPLLMARFTAMPDNIAQHVSLASYPTLCVVLIVLSGASAGRRIVRFATAAAASTLLLAPALVPVVNARPYPLFDYVPPMRNLLVTYESVAELLEDGPHTVVFPIDANAGDVGIQGEAWGLLAWLETRHVDVCVYREAGTRLGHALPMSLYCPPGTVAGPLLVVSDPRDTRFENLGVSVWAVAGDGSSQRARVTRVDADQTSIATKALTVPYIDPAAGTVRDALRP